MADDSAPTTAPSMLDRVRNMLAITTGPAVGTDLDPDPKPWDGADGKPITGEEGVMPATFEPDVLSTDWLTSSPGPSPRVEAPVPTRTEQPTHWNTGQYSLVTTETKRIMERNPRRIRAEVYVKSANVVYLAPTDGWGTRGFPCEEGYPFLTDCTGEVWATTSSDQTIYVLEFFRNDHVPELDGLG